LFTHDEPKATAAMRKEQQWRRRRRHGAAATRDVGGGGAEKMAVTAEVVLGLFWSGFGSIKYMNKIQRRMYGRWKMMNLFYYLRNKKKKTKCRKEQKDLPFLYFYLYMKIK